MQTATTTISPLDRVVDMVQLFTAAVEGRVRAPEDRDLEAVVDLTYTAAVDAIRAWGQATRETNPQIMGPHLRWLRGRES